MRVTELTINSLEIGDRRKYEKTISVYILYRYCLDFVDNMDYNYPIE
jgi:hypothetical protein